MKHEITKFEEYAQSVMAKGYNSAGKQGTLSKSYKQDMKGYDTISAIIKHPIVRACNKIKINAIIKGGGRVVNNKQNQKKALDSFNKNFQSHKVMPRIMWQLAQYSCFYGEIVKDGNNRLKSLPTRDANSMEHLLDAKGNLRGFVQILDMDNYNTYRDSIARQRQTLTENSSYFRENQGKVVYYNLDEILYISTDHLDSSTLSRAEILTLSNSLYNIDLMEKFISWLFESNQFRTAIRVPTGMSDAEYKKYLQALMDSIKHFDRFLLLRGDGIQHEPLRGFDNFDNLLSLLSYYKNQILALLQVTPVQVTETSDSGRGSSDTQYRYVNYDDIRAKRELIAKGLEFDLFPLIGLEDCQFKWNPVDMIEKKEIVELAQMFLSMNANVKKVNQWLIDEGINVPKNFLEEVEVMENKNEDESNDKVSLDKNSSLHPSRKPVNGEEGGKATEDLERK